MDHDQPVPPAMPHDDIASAVEAVTRHLEARGLGRWGLWPLALSRARPGPDGSVPVTVPIVAPDGTPPVVLRAADPPPPGGYRPGHLEEVHALARLLGTLLAADRRADRAARRAATAESAALTDPLTGLPNARGWQDGLAREGARCRRTGVTAVVAVVDLDDLKAVNDSEGHLVGDVLLRAAADALRASVRASDLVARIGGDEFGVLAVDCDDPVPDPLVERLRSRLAAGGVRASIGAVVHRPDADIQDSLHAADRAMYEVKARRKK